MEKILVTGATGYIGSQLISKLHDDGYSIYALVRNPANYKKPYEDRFELLTGDLDKSDTLEELPQDIDAAYYLVHGMANTQGDFSACEKAQALHFREAVEKTNAQQIIYLSGLGHQGQLSKHLSSRQSVEAELKKGTIACTVLRAGIIIGNGSASYEIIRDLAEKLPFMITPRWLRSKCQPIAIADAIFFLTSVLFQPESMRKTYDIGSDEQLTYKSLLLGYAKVRGLRRYIFSLPLFTPRLSSYWLYFVTSTNYRLAMSLVDSLKNDAICQNREILDAYPRDCLSYQAAVEATFQNNGKIPKFGVLVDHQFKPYLSSREATIEKLWNIGGENGWYAYNWLWKIRALFDRLVGGVGFSRKNPVSPPSSGQVLDFWTVVTADKEAGKLILKADMKMPGEAWLEFHCSEERLSQKATLRPKGLLGRAYWYVLLPIHKLIFRKMAEVIAQG